MSLNKLLTGTLLVQLIILGTLFFAPAKTRTQPANAAQTFDHSNCQYPDRTTNPPDGCDNTDPACPETVKGGSGDCPESDNQQNIVENAVIPTKTEPISQCGGK
jgi:hypothetical protein